MQKWDVLVSTLCYALKLFFFTVTLNLETPSAASHLHILLPLKAINTLIADVLASTKLLIHQTETEKAKGELHNQWKKHTFLS